MIAQLQTMSDQIKQLNERITALSAQLETATAKPVKARQGQGRQGRQTRRSPTNQAGLSIIQPAALPSRVPHGLRSDRGPGGRSWPAGVTERRPWEASLPALCKTSQLAQTKPLTRIKEPPIALDTPARIEDDRERHKEGCQGQKPRQPSEFNPLPNTILGATRLFSNYCGSQSPATCTIQMTSPQDHTGGRGAPASVIQIVPRVTICGKSNCATLF